MSGPYILNAFAKPLDYGMIVRIQSECQPFFAVCNPAQIYAAIQVTFRGHTNVLETTKNLGPFVFVGCALLPDNMLPKDIIKFYSRSGFVVGIIESLQVPLVFFNG